MRLCLTKNGLLPLALTAALFIIPPSLATAQALPAEMQQTQIGLSRQIEEQKAVVDDWNEKERAVLDEIDRIGRELDAQKRALDQIKIEANNVEDSLARLSKEITLLELRTEANKQYVLESVTALYKAKLMGNISALASAEDIVNLSLRQRILNEIVSRDYDLWYGMLTDLDALKVAHAEMSDLQGFRAKKMEEVNVKLAEINAIRSQNQALLKSISKERDLQVAALVFMEESANKLDAALGELTENQPKPNDAPKNAPSKTFSASKGLLIMPVKGKIASKFGPYTPPGQELQLFRKGVDIQAPPQTPVNAVFAGTVIFADWFKGYGNMLIIDHGDGYYTVYARLGKMLKERNQLVLSGETIGETNSDSGLSGQDLYFEIRYHAEPLNPAVWLSKK